MAAIERILNNDYPSYFSVWTELYDEDAAGRSEVCRASNMFITTYAEFELYCNWLFDILFKMRNALGDKPDADRNMRRYCAFMGERLLSVYLQTNNKSVLSVEMRYKKWWIPYLGKIRRLLNINKASKFYKFMKEKLGYKSSYK